MAKNKVEIDVKVDDKGTLGKVGLGAKKSGDKLDGLGKNVRTADRNLKGVARTSSNTTKNFSKMAQGTGGLVGVYATFAAQMFALSAAFQFFKNAADLENLRKSQISMAQGTGLALKSVTAELQEASKGMLGFKEAAQAAAIGVAKGFSTSQLTELTEGALKASTALGRGFEDTFDRLLRGVSKAEPELLDELGITLRLENAMQRYGDAIKVSKDSLTDAQRSQAVFVETMRQLNNTFGEVEGKANPFVVLGKTFEKIAQDITEKALPAILTITDVINENATVAAYAFGALAALIIVNLAGVVPFVTSMVKNVVSAMSILPSAIGSVASKVNTRVQTVVDSGLDQVIAQIDAAEKKLEQVAKDAGNRAKSQASDMVEGGAKSATLSKLSLGEEITPQALGRLRKDLARVRKDLEDTGKTASKAFAGMSVEAIDKLQKELDQMSKKTISFGQKAKKVFAQVTVSALKKTRHWAKEAGGAIREMNSKVKDAGGAFSIMGRAATASLGWITLIVALVTALDELAKKPKTVVDGFQNFIISVVRMLQSALNVLVGGINSVIEKIPGARKLFGDGITNFTFADDIQKKTDEIRAKALDFFNVTEDDLATTEKKTRELEEQTRRLDTLKRKMKELGEEGGIIAKGILGEEDENKKTKKIATGIGSLPLVSAMKAVEENPELQAAFDSMIENLNLDAFGTQFKDAVTSGSIKKVEAAQTAALTYTSSLASLDSSLGNLGKTLNNSTTVEGVIALVDSFSRTQGAMDESAKAIGRVSEAKDRLDKAFGGDFNKFKTGMEGILVERSSILSERSGLKQRSARSGSLNAASRDKESKEIAILMASNKLREQRNNLDSLNKSDTVERGPVEASLHIQKKAALQEEIALQEILVNQAQNKADDIAQMGIQIGDSLTNNMTAAFTALVEGTKSAKEAFGDMAKAILSDIAKMITKMLVMKILQDSIGGPLGGFLGFMKDGGMTPPKGYARGGVARGPTSGYPTILHGSEAIVPLPDGRSIPVEMKSGGGDVNNIVVNISSDGSTRKEGSTGPDIDKLGAAVAKAVQDELHNQKRSGGILNPYGVA